MDVNIISEDEYGDRSYSDLFTRIMADINKLSLIEKATLVLKPTVPLFIFSVRMRAEPSSKTVADAANARSEGANVHLTITDERYAPSILEQLWKKFGRESVDQQTRFDLDVIGASESEVKALLVASDEESVNDMIGAIWRTMPEGIKNRRTFIDGRTITVVATEEIMEPYMLEEGMKIHTAEGV
ncbi:MAG: methanogenesis marker 17 protein [Candidatus Methanoplasma sp.]|jgi:putative methanogenesis marker protein 17|nr:methanogenesis marker 17 protein [Candidatus Methanoplasma sp.]